MYTTAVARAVQCGYPLAKRAETRTMPLAMLCITSGTSGISGTSGTSGITSGIPTTSIPTSTSGTSGNTSGKSNNLIYLLFLLLLIPIAAVGFHRQIKNIIIERRMRTFTLSKTPTSCKDDQVKNMTFIPTKETLAKVRATLNSGWRPPIIKKDDEKQKKDI